MLSPVVPGMLDLENIQWRILLAYVYGNAGTITIIGFSKVFLSTQIASATKHWCLQWNVTITLDLALYHILLLESGALSLCFKLLREKPVGSDLHAKCHNTSLFFMCM